MLMAIFQDPITLSPKKVSEKLTVQGHITSKWQARTQIQSFVSKVYVSSDALNWLNGISGRERMRKVTEFRKMGRL